MKYILVLWILLIGSLTSHAQISNKAKLSADNNINTTVRDTARTSKSNTKVDGPSFKTKATIDQYSIVSRSLDTTFVDTTLTIQKNYKFNYLRKDNFNLISFANMGQTYNTLSYDFDTKNTLPVFGARARHFNYMEVDDINYYHVATPLTELVYKTAFQQGQLLDAFVTLNTTPNFNFSIAYKGLRSLGKYQHALTSTGNFRFTSSYQSPNARYQARAHIVLQDLLNQENGGLTDADVENFESGNAQFNDRSVFAPNFENAENILEGKRFFIDHHYSITKPSDSLVGQLGVGQTISFEDKYFQFRQSTQNSYFGDAFKSLSLNDKVTLEHFSNSFYVDYKHRTLGDLRFNVDYDHTNYGYDALVNINSMWITNRLKDETITLGGAYKKQFRDFRFDGKFGVNVTGDYDGHFLNARATLDLSKDFAFSAQLNSNSRMPNYNTLLYHSDYINYNWDNSSRFNTVDIQQVELGLQSELLGDFYFDYTRIDNYTFFKKDLVGDVKPFQHDETVNYIRLKYQREFKFGNFALDNTVMYQNVLDGEAVLKTPEFVTRNTFYYSNHVFKKAMFLQTGITFNYFKAYHMNAYDPLLAEFYVQDQVALGDFPRMDFFINAQIRQTRIYVMAEHFNSAFTGNNYYSAPNYPYRDFAIRFGVVWNFFL